MANQRVKKFKFPCPCRLKSGMLTVAAVKKKLNRFLKSIHETLQCVALGGCECYQRRRRSTPGTIGSWRVDLDLQGDNKLSGNESFLKDAVKCINGKIEGVAPDLVRVRVLCDHVHIVGHETCK